MTRRRIVVGLALLAVVAGMVALSHPGRNPVLGTGDGQASAYRHGRAVSCLSPITCSIVPSCAVAIQRIRQRGSPWPVRRTRPGLG